MFAVFMAVVVLVWLVLLAPAARDLGRLIGLPPGVSFLGWLVASLAGHDDVAEEVSPATSWVLSKGEAQAASGWHAALVWAAENPATVLAGAAGLVLGTLVPEHLASLGAIVLVRGLPGSGKSTWAAGQAGAIRLDGGQARVVSADDWFTVRDPRGPVAYLFDPAQLPQAHADCLRRAKAGHDQGEVVYVANTFTQGWEMAPYLAMGASVVVCPPVPGRLGVHGVPQEAWDRMAARWEAHPGETLLPPQGVPVLCGYCGFLTTGPAWATCDACGYHTERVYPWTRPKEYWRSNGQGSVSLGQCNRPAELTCALRESQGTADWRGWSVD